MKKLIAILLLIPCFSQAQVKIYDTSETPKGEIIGKYDEGSLVRAYVDTDTVYQLTYRNYEYIHLNVNSNVVFKAGSEDVENIYLLLKTFFIKENFKNKDYKRTLVLGNKTFTVAPIRGTNPAAIRLVTDRSIFAITERQLDKLFGKRR